MNLKYNPYLLYIAFWFANRLQEFETTAVQKKANKNKTKTKEFETKMETMVVMKVTEENAETKSGTPMDLLCFVHLCMKLHLFRLIYVVLTTSQTAR